MNIPVDIIATIVAKHGVNRLGRRLRRLFRGKGRSPGMFIEMPASKRRAFRRACFQFALRQHDYSE